MFFFSWLLAVHVRFLDDFDAYISYQCNFNIGQPQLKWLVFHGNGRYGLSSNLGPLLRCRLHKARPRDSSGRMTFVSPVQLVPKVHQNQCFHIRSPKKNLLHLSWKSGNLPACFKFQASLVSPVQNQWGMTFGHEYLGQKKRGNNSEKSVVYKEFSVKIRVWSNPVSSFQKEVVTEVLWTFRHFSKDVIHLKESTISWFLNLFTHLHPKRLEFHLALDMSRFVSALAALALLILLDGFARSWHHGIATVKTRSHRRLKDELLTDAVDSVDLRHFPEIPNLLRAPSCPGDWPPVLSLTYWLVAVLFGCCVFIVSFVITVCVIACLEKHGCGDLLVEWWCLKLVSFWGGSQGPNPLKMHLCAPLRIVWEIVLARGTNRKSGPSNCAALSVLLLLLLMAGVVSGRFSGQLCEMLPTKLQWHIYLPAHWQQVLRCHYLSFIRVPADVLPKNAGAALSTEDQSARLQFYGSLLILIVLAAFGIGKLLTLGARICRRDTYLYQEFNTEASSEVPPQQLHTPLWAHISLHFFCAALALLAADFGLLSIQCGVCWEIYVLWLLVMLIAGMLQAFHGLVHLPSDAVVPDLGKPIVTPVLPILGNWPYEPY